MGSDVEPAKKILLPYLQRADELQKHEPLVAYYCRLYAMERGLKIPAKERTKTTNAILVSLMNQLEKDKKTIQVSPDDNLHVEGFALNVFRKADKQDRAGRADINTAKTFYAASIFIEILHQFGPLQPDLEQKQKYAVWKAADIRKALSEGRKPVPGPPGGEEDLYASDSGGEAKTSFDTDSLKAPEQRPPAEQGPNIGSGISTPSLGDVTFTPHAFQSDQRQHYPGTNVEHEVPHQGPDPGFSGYTAPYPGSFYTYPAAHDASVSPPDTHQYGSNAHLDPYNMPPYNHHDQSSLADGSVPTMPITYAGVNEVSDAVYYQPPGGHFQNAVVYPTSTALNDSLRPSGAAPVARPKDSTGLERTSSAPAATVETQMYQPPPQRIADAQKAARFAVSALAFDDVATATSYLRQSLDLLTNPAAVPHREG